MRLSLAKWHRDQGGFSQSSFVRAPTALHPPGPPTSVSKRGQRLGLSTGLSTIEKFIFQAMSEASDSHPGYTVTRHASRKGPHFIHCLRTDGLQSKLRDVGAVTDSTGATCYWRSDDEATNNLVEKWKKTLGKTLAKHLKLIDGKIFDFSFGHPTVSYVRKTKKD